MYTMAFYFESGNYRHKTSDDLELLKSHLCYMACHSGIEKALLFKWHGDYIPKEPTHLMIYDDFDDECKIIEVIKTEEIK